MLLSKKGFDDLGRPSWDLYFINLAFAISQRSFDPRTKVGCVFVSSDDYSLLMSGFNGPPSGFDDRNCITDTPEDLKLESKYDYFSHAEESGIAKAAKNGIALKNSILYVTAQPCHLCLRKVINAGIKEIVYVNTRPICVDDKSIVISKKMLECSNIAYREFMYSNGLIALNKRYVEYLKVKNII